MRIRCSRSTRPNLRVHDRLAGKLLILRPKSDELACQRHQEKLTRIAPGSQAISRAAAPRLTETVQQGLLVEKAIVDLAREFKGLGVLDWMHVPNPKIDEI